MYLVCTTPTVFHKSYAGFYFKCFLEEYITLGLQYDNCLTFFFHFELSKFLDPNSNFSELSSKTKFLESGYHVCPLPHRFLHESFFQGVFHLEFLCDFCRTTK